jgi:alpha-galactosidase
MSLWVMLASPLLAGNDLNKVKPEDLAILENRDAIAIDQDPLDQQGDRFSAVGPYEIWRKPLAHGRQAIALFNRGELAHTMAVPFRDLQVPVNARIRDVWAGRDFAVSDGYAVSIPKHGVVLLLAEP